MSSKSEKPTLQGQRIKTRKRDEKEKFDPTGFRDSILQGFLGVQKQSPSTSSIDGDSNEKSITSNQQPQSQPQGEQQQPQQPQQQQQEGEEPAQQQEPGQSEENGLNEVTNGGLKNGGSDEFISNTSNSSSTNSTITKSQLDAISKFLDNSGSKLDYRRYGEVLFDILIAGGYLAPGGTIVTDNDPMKICKTDICVFNVPADDLETIRAFANIIVKFIRRFMYLEKTLEEEFKKVIVFQKGFSSEERIKLAKLTALLISGGQLPASVLASALQDHFIRDGLAIDFLVTVLQTWLTEKDAVTVWTSLKKSGLDNRVMEYLPVSKRSPEYLATLFMNSGLDKLLTHQRASLNGMIKKELGGQVAKLLKDQAQVKEIITQVKESVAKNSLPESEVVVLLWNTLMSAVEWNKKEELVADQAIKHLRLYTSFLAEFTKSTKSELALIIRIQEYCYDNMNFLKVFQKIIFLLYKTEVISEDVIMRWYKESHSSKGKSIFLEQMKKFIEWLQNADEESEDED